MQYPLILDPHAVPVLAVESGSFWYTLSLTLFG